MSYLKTLNSNDVTVTPFTVHKGFNLHSNNSSFSLYSAGEPEFESIKHLFYSNYIKTGSDGRVSEASLPIRNPDGTITGERDTTNYDNREQSSFELRYFPTESDAKIWVLSIPQQLYGNYIKPSSFNPTLVGFNISTNTTESNGNISNTWVDNGTSFNYGTISGNVFYKEGLIVYTSSSIPPAYTNGFFPYLTSSFSSSLTLYETQYKCTIRANEFNYSLNPSLKQSGSFDQYQDFVTGSDFSPYVTTVGLYNENQELLAVAKLAQPLPTSQTTDTTILINLDR